MAAIGREPDAIIDAIILPDFYDLTSITWVNDANRIFIPEEFVSPQNLDQLRLQNTGSNLVGHDPGTRGRRTPDPLTSNLARGDLPACAREAHGQRLIC